MLWLQNSVLIQPRTSRLKFDDLAQRKVRYRTFQLRSWRPPPRRSRPRPGKASSRPWRGPQFGLTPELGRIFVELSNSNTSNSNLTVVQLFHDFLQILAVGIICLVICEIPTTFGNVSAKIATKIATFWRLFLIHCEKS